MAVPETAATAGLDGLEGLALEVIISRAGARAAAALACTSTRLRAASSGDSLWRRFCAADFDVSGAVGPDGQPLPSFKETYKVWAESFSMYPLPLVKRVKQFWCSMKGWLAANFPEALDTLKKGASEAQIQSAEEALGFKLPMPTKVLYRFCDGQLDPKQNVRIAPLGIIGGYKFYDHLVNVHLLPLEQIVKETKEYACELDESCKSKLIAVAVSWYLRKEFFLDCSTGQLYVGTKNVAVGEMMPCVPKSLIRPTTNSNNDMPQDALLLWLEEHLRRLQSGMIRIRAIRELRYICLYPEAPPSCSSAVTNGVKVRASAVFVPENSDLNSDRDRYFFSYSIRLSLPEACMLDGMYYSSCQLRSRHWIIRSRDRVVSDVHADAVIGQYPLLSPGMEEFVYESCTPIPHVPGSVEGSFTFVPGRLSRPEGRQFDVTVALFPLEKPDYIF